MKTISLQLPDDIADKLLSVEDNKRALIFKFIIEMVEGNNWKDLFNKTSDQAKRQGLTEEKLDELLSKEEMVRDMRGQTKNKDLAKNRSLSEIMTDASEQAKRNGLTEEILDQILKEIDEERKA
jgi:predicted metal-dependent phosphotriesterase family hydrolase